MIWRTIVWGSIGIFSYNCYLVSNETKEKPAENQIGALPGFIGAARSSYEFYGNMMEVKPNIF